ncbi:hypothetical protein BJ742DRAFT_794731 [Cladochytrium replicatum]|nr:hypothetical protein BJ742DRAFT_794731 [Cladochytrium replicatum]
MSSTMDLPFNSSDDLPHDIDQPDNPIPRTLVNSIPLEGSKFIAPYVPCAIPVVHAALSFADVRKGDVLIDLGCGDGRILSAALESHSPPDTCIGVELDPYLSAHLQDTFSQYTAAGNVRLVHADMFSENFLVSHNATVAVLYLLPAGLEKLKPSIAEWLAGGGGVRDPHVETQTKPKASQQSPKRSTVTQLGSRLSWYGKGGSQPDDDGSQHHPDTIRRVVTITYSIPGWTPSKAVCVNASATAGVSNTEDPRGKTDVAAAVIAGSSPATARSVGQWLFFYDVPAPP